MIFRFEKTTQCSSNDKRFVDQLCVQMGYVRNVEDAYISGDISTLLDNYPNIAVLRDLVFMLKLLMLPAAASLPEEKNWEPIDATLKWSCANGAYKVKAFDRALDCVLPVPPAEGKPVRGILNSFLIAVGVKNATPRVSPSRANPSVLIGERVDTEDDILHIKALPDFGGTMGGRDCEFMLQYLLAPYLRIPLMLNFFSHEARLRSLRNKSLQEVLDAALFEPGLWQEEHVKVVSDQIPAESRDNLSTSAGLLFNEIIKSPTVVLSAIHDILLKVLDMDTGRYTKVSEAILYVIRLCVRVEGFLVFLTKNKTYHNAAGEDAIYGACYEAQVRGLECSDALVAEAMEFQSKIRDILEGRIVKVLARWIKRAKKEGHIIYACKIHAHLAFIYRNVEAEDLDDRKIFSMLASQIYILSSVNLDLDAARNDNPVDLGIPYLELYDMFQRNRNKIISFLDASEASRNMVSPYLSPHLLLEWFYQIGSSTGDGRCAETHRGEQCE